MKNIKMIILTIVSYSMLLGFLVSCFSTSMYTDIPPGDYKEAARREEEANKKYNDKQWQNAVEDYTMIINFWERENPGIHYSRTKRERLVSLYVHRGNAYKKLNDLENAESDYSRSLSVIENGRNLLYEAVILRFEPVLAFARLHSEKGDYDSALKEMDAFINESLSIIPSYDGEYLDAAEKVREFDRHVQSEWITYYQAYYYRGLYYYHKQEYKKAAEDFHVAVMTSTIHYDPHNDSEEPWQVITDTLIKAEGANPYVKIIREIDYPREMAVVRDDGLNVYRSDFNDKEMICIAGKYTIKARDIDGLELVSELLTADKIEQTYQEVFQEGGVYHWGYDFLAGNVYSVTKDNISVH